MMAESDVEIEFLDEDADIVQQCVQTVQVPVQVPHLVPRFAAKSTPPLLVERLPPEKKRKKRKEEDDSDYDPTDDIVPPSPPSSKGKKKKQPVAKKLKTYLKEVVPTSRPGPSSRAGPSSSAGPSSRPGPSLRPGPSSKPGPSSRAGPSSSAGPSSKAGSSQKSVGPVQTRKPKLIHPKEVVLDRKKLNIRIPDYDDPLCLPVKAIRTEESDIKRIKNWNNVCLEHFKNCDTMLKPESGETYSSSRTLEFKNVANKQTGKIETTIWSKTVVENEEGDKKSEIFQCVLPRYKEKKVLTNFSLTARKPKPYHVIDEVILSKEEGKDGEVLVAYKPKEASSAVYKLVTPQDGKSSDPNEAEECDEDKMYMKEVVNCKMCAPCFQTSWRGVKKNTKKSVACPICSRSFVTVYNLLAHFKTHSSEDMKKYKKVISSILAEKVDYHYKCRICREQFISIKNLREHVSSHQGDEVFTCEVGNHMAR